MKKITPILTMADPWHVLRQECFGNVEPTVTLEAVTTPIEPIGADTPLTEGDPDRTVSPEIFQDIEQIPALAAGTSYGSRETLQDDPDRAVKLNKKLIKLGHHTPLEAIQLNFHVSGISKACGAQVSRHRVGQGHVSASRRFQEQGPRFVYPMLSYIKDREYAESVLLGMSRHIEQSYAVYNELRAAHEAAGDRPTLHKEDARLIIPVSTATERSWWINVRALRDFFRLRLARDAEWEIRRMSQMMFNIVYGMMPSLFEDIREKFESS